MKSSLNRSTKAIAVYWNPKPNVISKMNTIAAVIFRSWNLCSYSRKSFRKSAMCGRWTLLLEPFRLVIFCTHLDKNSPVWSSDVAQIIRVIVWFSHHLKKTTQLNILIEPFIQKKPQKNANLISGIALWPRERVDMFLGIEKWHLLLGSGWMIGLDLYRTICVLLTLIMLLREYMEMTLINECFFFWFCFRFPPKWCVQAFKL